MKHVSDADAPSGVKVPRLVLGSLLIRAVRAEESCCCCCCPTPTPSAPTCSGVGDALRTTGHALPGLLTVAADGVAWGVAAGLSSTLPEVYEAPSVLLPASAAGGLVSAASWFSGICNPTGLTGTVSGELLLGLGLGLGVTLGELLVAPSSGRGGNSTVPMLLAGLVEGDSVICKSLSPCERHKAC